MYEIKTNKKTKLGAYFTLLLCLMGAAAVIMTASVPIYADYAPSDLTLTFAVDNAIDYNVTPNEPAIIKVPLYVTVSVTGGSSSQFNYISGYIVYGGTTLTNSLACTVDGFVPNYLYYEPINNYDLTINRADSALVVYFDNYMFDANNSGSAYRKLIGYLCYSVSNSDSIASVRYSTYTVTPTPTSSSALNISNYETGFISAIIYALNNASDVDTVISILNNISSNTGYLPDILSYLQSYYPSYYNYLNTIASNTTSLNSYVISIFNILNDHYNSQASQAEDIKDDINDKMDNLIIDMEVSKPSAVADLADSYIQQIDTTYNSSVFSFLSFPFIILMLCIVFAFAVISYLLYGGQ